MIWQMVMCIGVYWGGCGSYMVADYPDESACQRALSSMRFPPDSSKRGAVAYCRVKP